jgi:hypothetical protein
MKVWKICLTIVGLGLLFMLASCSKEVTKDDTEGFLASLTTMFTEAMTNESNQVLSDFISNSPPGLELGSYVSLLGVADLDEGKLRDLRTPYGIDTLYGTWRYNVGTDEWYLYSPGDPENAILFEWAFLDSASVAHAAEILIDSLEFYEDSLPTNIWAGISLDDALLAWLKLEATYLSLEEVSAVSLTYEIVGYYQVGVSISSPTAIDSNFVGTVHLWVIDRTSNNYRVDLTVTRNADDSGELVLEDSDGWEMDLNVSEDVSTEPDYERRNISGEITEDGNHAADISGYIWDPDDGEDHATSITITFSDGTEGDLEDYLAVVLLTIGD